VLRGERGWGELVRLGRELESDCVFGVPGDDSVCDPIPHPFPFPKFPPLLRSWWGPHRFSYSH